MEHEMRHERNKTGYFITCGAGPAVGMELGWEWDSHSHSQVAGSKIVRFGRSGGDPKWPRLHPKGQAARQKKNKEENDFIYYTSQNKNKIGKESAPWYGMGMRPTPS